MRGCLRPRAALPSRHNDGAACLALWQLLRTRVESSLVSKWPVFDLRHSQEPKWTSTGLARDVCSTVLFGPRYCQSTVTPNCSSCSIVASHRIIICIHYFRSRTVSLYAIPREFPKNLHGEPSTARAAKLNCKEIRSKPKNIFWRLRCLDTDSLPPCRVIK